MTDDKALRFLIDKASGEDKRRDEIAINKLVALSDPSKREPEHRDNEAVMFLAGLTNAELRNQNRS